MKVTDVVVLEVPDHPGGLAGILNALEGTGINLEYAYAFIRKQKGSGLLVFRFSDPDAEVNATARQLTELLQTVDGALASSNSLRLTAEAGTLAQDVTDHITRRAIQATVVFFVMLLLYRVLVFRLLKKSNELPATKP